MPTLSAKTRKIIGKKVKSLRQNGVLPAVLYGPKIKTLPLQVDFKEFQKIYKETGESLMIDLEVEKKDSNTEKFSVLIKEINRDAIASAPIHIDFYQPDLKEKIEANVPLVFKGEAPAVKDLSGTLVKNILEVEVKAFPHNLPKEIEVNIEGLKAFEDHIQIKDLKLPEGVEILKEAEESVILVMPPEKVEEELEKPIEEDVEKVEIADEKKEKEDEDGEESKEKEKSGEKKEK